MLGALPIALDRSRASPPAATPEEGEGEGEARGDGPGALPRSRRTAPPPRPATPAEKKDVAPVRKPALGLEGMGRTPAEQKQLDELQDMLRSYEAESREFKQDVQLLVEKKYEEKRSDLSASYEKAIRDLEVTERKDRLDAIAQFEEFLQRYPDEPRYTPDVMFRLAELYYERSARRSRGGHARLRGRAQAAGPVEQRPAPARAGGGLPAVDRPLPAAPREVPQVQVQRRRRPTCSATAWRSRTTSTARQEAYRDVIEQYPKSKFVTEAWVRIGEYYFDDYDDPDALAKAAQAYEAAARDTKSPLYDKALYKLGWTYYRQDRFEPAVQRFLAAGRLLRADRAEEGRQGHR